MWPSLLVFAVGAAPVWAGAPEPVLDLAPPWRVAHRDEDGVTLQLGDTAHGARVQWTTDARGRLPGVTPIAAGVPLETPRDGALWPLVALPFPADPVTSLVIEVDGPDLRVRFEGAPIRSHTDDPAAPEDPVRTWVRLRPRGADWRIVLDGLGSVVLPDVVAAHPAPERGVWLDSATHGQLTLESDAPRREAHWDGAAWMWSPTPSLAERAPYPRTALTWRPSP